MLLLTSLASKAQVVVAGISPQSIQGMYSFEIQDSCGQWPGEVENNSWGTWNGGLDFNLAGNYVQGNLILVDDGTMGTSSDGHPLQQEGCDSILNVISGNIALIYANSCEYSTKVYRAQEAGAIAVVIINTESTIEKMPANTDPINGFLGTLCNIPAVLISDSDGAALVTAMQSDTVELLIGNKTGVFQNDIGSQLDQVILPSFRVYNIFEINKIPLGIQITNNGVSDLPNASVTGIITDPIGDTLYNETINMAIMAGDTVNVFSNEIISFPVFNTSLITSLGDFELRYTVNAGTNDAFPSDNSHTHVFSVRDDAWSLVDINQNYGPSANFFPNIATTEYQSCVFYQDTTGGWPVEKDALYMVPHTDTSLYNLAGAEIFINVYEWNDNWTDLNDPNYSFDPTTTNAYSDLNLITFGVHYPVSNFDVDQPAYVPFQSSVQVLSNKRYLFCLQTFDSQISFGYNSNYKYDANVHFLNQPIAPIYVDGSWITNGWNNSTAPAITIIDRIGSLETNTGLQTNIYPNPANDRVTLSVNTSGNADLQIVDIAGKVIYSGSVVITNGQVDISISEFASGSYVFRLTDQNGQSDQFSVVKQ